MERVILNETRRVIVCGTVNLIPGANVVSEDALRANEAYLQVHVERGSIELPSFEVEDDLAESLIGSYNVKDAKKIIEETNDLDALEVYKADELKGEARKGVLDALKKQIKKLNDALKKDAK